MKEKAKETEISVYENRLGIVKGVRVKTAKEDFVIALRDCDEHIGDGTFSHLSAHSRMIYWHMETLSKQQAKEILLHIDEVNSLLKEIGGEEMKGLYVTNSTMEIKELDKIKPICLKITDGEKECFIGNSCNEYGYKCRPIYEYSMIEAHEMYFNISKNCNHRYTVLVRADDKYITFGNGAIELGRHMQENENIKYSEYHSIDGINAMTASFNYCLINEVLTSLREKEYFRIALVDMLGRA